MGVMALNPGYDLLQAALTVGRVIAEGSTADQGILPAVLVVQLCYRDVELSLQPAEQGLELAALFFQ